MVTCSLGLGDRTGHVWGRGIKRPFDGLFFLIVTQTRVWGFPEGRVRRVVKGSNAWRGQGTGGHPVQSQVR